MVITGAYVTWYAIYEIRVQGGSFGTSGPVDMVFGWSGDLQNWLSGVGAVRIGLILGLLMALAAMISLLRVKSRTPDPVE